MKGVETSGSLGVHYVWVCVYRVLSVYLLSSYAPLKYLSTYYPLAYLLLIGGGVREAEWTSGGPYLLHGLNGKRCAFVRLRG